MSVHMPLAATVHIVSPQAFIICSKHMTFSLPADVAGNAVDANYLPTKPIPAPAVLGGSVTVNPLSPAAALSAVSNTGGSITNERGTVPADVIVVGIDTRIRGRQVPLGFLGPSLEWDAMGYYGRDPQLWAKMFTVLGPGHVIRLGGASQEQITKVRLRALMSLRQLKCMDDERSGN